MFRSGPFLWIAWTCALAVPLHLVAVFPAEESRGAAFARALRRAVGEADGPLAEKDVTLVATAFYAPRKPPALLAELCDAVRKQRPPPAALLSFVGLPSSFYVSLLGGYARIPVLAATGAYSHPAPQDVNPFYLSLDPKAEDLAHAVGLFLESNGWTRAILMKDASTFYSDFARALRRHPIGGPDLQLVATGRLPPDEARLFDVVSEVPRSEVRVVVVACSRQMAERLFRQARRANLLDGRWIWILVESAFDPRPSGRELGFPSGVLGLRLRTPPLDRASIRSAVLFAASAVSGRPDIGPWTLDEHLLNYSSPASCWFGPGDSREVFARLFYSWALDHRRSNGSGAPGPAFDVYNLVPSGARSVHRVSTGSTPRRWRRIGNVTGGRVFLSAVLWLGGARVGPPEWNRRRYRVVTAFAPPFVMPATRVENGSCLQGLPCLQVRTRSKAELALLFADFWNRRVLEGKKYNVSCCAGMAIDLLKTLSEDLCFVFDLYLVADGLFGTGRGDRWNGMTLDVQSGTAHMAFSAFSMTSERSRVIDYSVPFYHSGVSCLTFTQERDVPLSAFLVPFSAQLWIAIFASLNMTAIVAAIYEWLSPFGLNPWGRMRTKNFSLASALWVMWSLLFSHLVAFKAPKSWPNKVLINLWGCFSVIFVSTYTANIAAHFAGLFFHLRVDDFHDASLLNQRTGAPKSSAAESYIHAQNPQLWQHIQKYGFADLEEGLQKLRKGQLDVVIGDTVVLDYIRGNEPGCGLHLLGQSIFEDAYAVGMQKGFRLKKSISALILRYNEHGFMEQLQKKWFGRVPCFHHSVSQLNKPKPLSLGAVAGVFVMLLLGLVVGILILIIEHAVFKHALPQLRKKPAQCFWRSPNLMFFSQKLYRFINTVELVSPHHSAKEIVTNLREGQIFSLFQKSLKRKDKEDARRRKNKSQFFEMIEDIRKMIRLQKEQRRNPEHMVSIQPQDAGSPLDKQRLLLVAQTSDSPSKGLTSWSDLYRHGPSLFGATPYSQLPQPDEPRTAPLFLRTDSPLENASSSSSDDRAPPAFETTVLSVSVEDLRLTDSPPTQWPPARRCKSLDEGMQSCNYLQSPNKVPTASEPKMAARRLPEVEELLLYSMSKEEIIRSWRACERKLLNKLRDAVREKKTLERKLAFIQKTLVKPP